MSVDDLFQALTELLGDDRRPVVVAAALWPLARETGVPVAELADALSGFWAGCADDGRTIMMPTLIAGFRAGFCDLDTEPSTTGVLSETFRRRPGVRRTLSVYSSYAVLGPDADEVLSLRPDDVWGEGSHLAWMEDTDARFIMLATHPTHCVYLHRVEWLVRDRLPYRYPKTFTGRVIHEGRERDLTETLLVRSLEPEAVQDFTGFLPALVRGGLRQWSGGGAPIAEISAQAVRAAALPVLEADPLAAISNPGDFRQ